MEVWNGIWKKMLVWNGIWNGRFSVWNGNGIKENCQYGIWKNRLLFHSIPCPAACTFSDSILVLVPNGHAKKYVKLRNNRANQAVHTTKVHR